MPVSKPVPKLHPVTHVLFDMDGLLLDTETKYDEVIEKVTEKYGFEFSQEIRKDVFGQSMIDLGHYLVKNRNLPITPQEFVKEVEEGLKMFKYNKVPFMPGAERLVKHLYEHQIPICIATGSTYDMYKMKSSHYPEFFSQFSHIVNGPDDPEVMKGKPSPEIYLVAARRFPSPPTDMKSCLVFEDSTTGVRAGRNAGMQAVWVPPPGYDTEGSGEDPTLVLSSLEKFDPTLFGLPAFKE